MIEYIKWTIADFPEEITSTKTTPAADWLFDVRPEGEAAILPEEQAVAFHHAVAQLLFLCNRSWRDIQTAVLFLMTRVRKPDKDVWGKLKRVLGYLQGTLHMPLVLGADSLTTAWWWVDASYSVHGDCKGHTGAGMSFGQGMPLSYSWKLGSPPKQNWWEWMMRCATYCGAGTSWRSRGTPWNRSSCTKTTGV